MYYGTASPCVICHDHGDQSKKNKLMRMEQLVRDLPEDDTIRYPLMWGIHSHCRYGIHCSRLSSFDTECGNITRRIERKVITAALKDEAIYHQILELCRGDFATVYRNLEDIHLKYSNKSE